MYFKIINQYEKDNTTEEQVNDKKKTSKSQKRKTQEPIKNREQCSNSLVIRKTCKINIKNIKIRLHGISSRFAKLESLKH